MSKQQRCLNWAPARTYPRAREPRRLKKPGPVKTGELLNAQLILVISHNTLMVKQAEGELTAWLTDINPDGAANAVMPTEV